MTASQGNLNTSGQKGKNTPHQLSVAILLKKIADYLYKVSGAGGFEYLSSGTHTGKAFRSIIVQSNTQFSVLKGGSNGKSHDYFSTGNLSGVTLTQNALLEIDDGEVITDLTFTGSIIGYK